MKKILGYTMLFLLMGTGMQAQDFDLGDIMGEAQDFFGNATETAENEADDAAWENINNQINKKLDDPKLKKLMGGFSEALKKFEGESMTGKCLQIMGAYAELLAYCDMRAESETEPCKKKEWLGIESMILLAGTSINYCPQEFYGLADFDDPDEETQREIVANYEAKINVYFFGNVAVQQAEMVKEWFKLNYLGEEQFKKHFPNSGMTYEEFTKLPVGYQSSLINFLSGKIIKDMKEIEKSDPHLQLFYKFYNANEQLQIIKKNETKQVGYLVDFVSEMFTPQFMLKKTMEIASESSAQKCRN